MTIIQIAAVTLTLEQVLQQTPFTTLLEFLEQELRKEKKAADQASREMDFCKHLRNGEHIEYVMKLIKERQPIAATLCGFVMRP